MTHSLCCKVESNPKLVCSLGNSNYLVYARTCTCIVSDSCLVSTWTRRFPGRTDLASFFFSALYGNDGRDSVSEIGI